METLFTAISAVSGFTLYNSLNASVLIVLVLLAQRLLARQLSALGRYLLWLTVVISLVTPIGFATRIPQLPVLPVPPTILAPAVRTDNRQAPPPSTVAESERNRSTTSMERVEAEYAANASHISPAEVLPVAWLGGVLLFIGAVLLRHNRFAKIVRTATPAATALQDLLDDCRDQAGCQREVHLLCSPDIDAPLVAGCLRVSLMLPTGIEHQLTDAQLRHVFVHELMHVSNHDIFTNWLLTLLQALHWFNPLVWLGFNWLRQDRELVRDAATLDLLEPTDRQAYGWTLLQLSQPLGRRFNTVGAVGIVDDRLQLKRRIAMIVRNSSPSRLQTLIAGTLLLLFGTMAFCKPTLIGTTAENEVPMVAAAPAASATGLSAAAVTAPVMDRAEAIINEPVVSAPAKVVGKRIVAAKKAAIVIPAAAKATAEKDQVGLIAANAATGPSMTVVQADPVAPAVAQVDVQSAVIKPETYPDWKEVEALATAVTQARDPGIKAITDWNSQAQECGVPSGNFAPLDLNYGKVACRKIIEAIEDTRQIGSFWSQCEHFGSTYNRLASTYTRADKSQFVDQALVRKELLKSFLTLNEFCSTAAYQQKYPAMITLIRHTKFWQTGTSYYSKDAVDYRDAYPNGTSQLDYHWAYNNGQSPGN